MQLQVFVILALIVLLGQVWTIRAEDYANDDLERRGAGSNSGASNVNNIDIRLKAVCRMLAKKKREGKRDLTDLVKRGAGSSSGASNVNNIDIKGVKPACKAMGYKV